MMTRVELIKSINHQIVIAPPFALGGYTKFLQALSAVVELHSPMESATISGETIVMCSGCYEEEFSHSDYPCQTIQAVQKELK